jgi:uncharacterized protein YxeA
MYKIENKKRFLIFILLILVGVFTLIAGGFFGWKKYKESKNNHLGKEVQETVYEAMIQTKGQDKYESEENKKTFFENGDVVVIFPEGHSWSSGEKGEAIIKLKLKKEDADKLMESETKETPSRDGEKTPERETMRLRKYRIDLDEIDFQKPDKIYDKGVIEEK